MNTMTAEDTRIERVLDDLSDATRALNRALEGVLADTNRALIALRQGARVSGMGIGYGPIGHQAPFEVATLTTKIDVLLSSARTLGATPEQIEAAYKVAS